MFAPEHDALADIEILYAGVCLYVRQRWLHVSYGASLRHSMVVAWLKGIEECWNKAQQQHDFFLEAHIDDNGGGPRQEAETCRLASVQAPHTTLNACHIYRGGDRISWSREKYKKCIRNFVDKILAHGTIHSPTTMEELVCFG